MDNSGNYIIGTTYYSLSFTNGKGYACGVAGYSKNNSIQGVNELDASSAIAVYPNPTSGKINIHSVDSRIQSFDIYNPLGEKVCSSALSSSQSCISIDLSKEQNGIYFLQMQTNEGIVNKKIVIQK